ncbi:MAG: DNA-protecting protein DprA [Bacteroidota bacterium]|jgi:DNA processing protein
MNEEIFYHLALTQVPQIGDIQIGLLLKHFGEPSVVFKANRKSLESIAGIGAIRAEAIKKFSGFNRVEKELKFIAKNEIEILVKHHEGYPSRLENCIDAPNILFYKGSQSLNQQHIVAVVGTRTPTDYGKERVAALIETLAQVDVLVVSGLAYGIDTLVHRDCVKYKVNTVGVLGHGLDQIYPSSNRILASEMIHLGGLLSEFMHGTKPDRQNFPKRNRIVAGMVDAVIVIESGEKGGSLITAEIANSYNKDVFAYPGRTTDLGSMGCNHLIRTHRADLITSGMDFIEFMGWNPVTKRKKAIQAELFLSLEGNEKQLYNLILEREPVGIDELIMQTMLKPSEVSSILFSLEMRGLVSPRPGKLYAAVYR